MENKIAKKGDIIQWDFKDHEMKDIFPETYTAEVLIVCKDCYGVYASYGQDYIPFDKATILKQLAHE